MSTQREPNVIIRQNMLIRNDADNSPKTGNSFSKKRRITSSMLYLDEEPVFSDSEEERDYTLKVFGKSSWTSTPKPPRNRETGTQCDIISVENSLLNLIESCSSLDPNVATSFSVLNKYLNELVQICQKIQSEMHNELEKDPVENCNEENSFGNQQFIEDKHPVASLPIDASSQDFLPSCGGNYPLNNSVVSRIEPDDEMMPSEPRAGEEVSKENNKLKVGKTRIKKKNDSDESLMRRSKREKHVPKKKFITEGVIMNSILKQKKKYNKRSGKTSRNKDRPNIPSASFRIKPKKMKKSSDKLDTCLAEADAPLLGCKSKTSENFNRHENLAKYLDNSYVHFKLPLPKKIIKPLARNWMKPNKSLILDETLKSQPHFASLRQEKRRKLYSPSRWMASDTFLNSLPRENEK